MKFQCLPNETIRMDDKVLGKADADGILVVDEQKVMDMFLARMKRAHKYLVVEKAEEKIVQSKAGDSKKAYVIETVEDILKANNLQDNLDKEKLSRLVDDTVSKLINKL